MVIRVPEAYIGSAANNPRNFSPRHISTSFASGKPYNFTGEALLPPVWAGGHVASRESSQSVARIA